MNNQNDSTGALATPRHFTCRAECIGDVARFILALEGRRGSFMFPVVMQPSQLDPIQVDFASLLSMGDILDVLKTIPDAHRMRDTLEEVFRA